LQTWAEGSQPFAAWLSVHASPQAEQLVSVKSAVSQPAVEELQSA